MRSPEEVKREIYEKWMRKANEDLAVADQLLVDGVPYFGAIGFHAQQAAEKFLKAFLVWHQIEFPKTHDLTQLLQLAGTRDRALSESLNEVGVLNDYGVDTRYPADLPELTTVEAGQAVELAKKTKEAIGKSLSSSGQNVT